VTSEEVYRLRKQINRLVSAASKREESGVVSPEGYLATDCIAGQQVHLSVEGRGVGLWWVVRVANKRAKRLRRPEQVGDYLKELLVPGEHSPSQR
jgi:hypothetical protein